MYTEMGGKHEVQEATICSAVVPNQRKKHMVHGTVNTWQTKYTCNTVAIVMCLGSCSYIIPRTE